MVSGILLRNTVTFVLVRHDPELKGLFRIKIGLTCKIFNEFPFLRLCSRGCFFGVLATFSHGNCVD